MESNNTPQTKDETMTTETKTWYVISPEGSAWVAVQLDAANRMVGLVEQSGGNGMTTIREAIANGEVSENVSPMLAAIVVRAYDIDMDAEMCCVERIVL